MNHLLKEIHMIYTNSQFFTAIGIVKILELFVFGRTNSLDVFVFYMHSFF